MTRICALLLLAALLLFGAGCTRLQFGYGQAERVIGWTLESYLPLDSRQSAALRQQLAEYKQWHCRTQVPAYAAWVRQVGDELRAGVTPQQVETRFANLRHFGRLLAEEASPRLAGLAGSLSDRQLGDLVRAFDKANTRYRKEFLDIGYDDVVAARLARTRDRLGFWLGTLGREQRHVIERWSASLEPAEAEMLQSRLRWQQALRDALAHRSDPDALRERLFVLMVEPERWHSPALVAVLEANRARTFAMIRDVAALMSDPQRRRLAERTATVAAELDGLVCPPPPRSTARTDP